MHIHSPRVFFKYEPTKLNTSTCGPSVTQEAQKKYSFRRFPVFAALKKKKRMVSSVDRTKNGSKRLFRLVNP